MTRPAKQLDELITITVPRSALTLVSPAPLTVTQLTCFELFGISPKDYKRLTAKRAFPHRRIGQLRVARYADVAAYLAPEQQETAVAPAPKPTKLDPLAYLVKAGAGPARRR